MKTIKAKIEEKKTFVKLMVLAWDNVRWFRELYPKYIAKTPKIDLRIWIKILFESISLKKDPLIFIKKNENNISVPKNDL